MSRGDLILTPTGLWHEHGHDGDAPVVWLDVLDLPLVHYLEASYHSTASARSSGPAAVTAPTPGAGLVPTPVGATAQPPALSGAALPWVEARGAAVAGRGPPGPGGGAAHLRQPRDRRGCREHPRLPRADAAPGQTLRLPPRSPASVFHLIEGAVEAAIDAPPAAPLRAGRGRHLRRAGLQRGHAAQRPHRRAAFVFIADESPLHRKLGLLEQRDSGLLARPSNQDPLSASLPLSTPHRHRRETCLCAPPSPRCPTAVTDARLPVHRIFCVGRNYRPPMRSRWAARSTSRSGCRSIHHRSPSDAGGAARPWPTRRGTASYHHEMELVVVIGKPGFRVAEADAARTLIWAMPAAWTLTRRDLRLALRDKGRPGTSQDIEQGRGHLRAGGDARRGHRLRRDRAGGQRPDAPEVRRRQADLEHSRADRRPVDALPPAARRPDLHRHARGASARWWRAMSSPAGWRAWARSR